MSYEKYLKQNNYIEGEDLEFYFSILGTTIEECRNENGIIYNLLEGYTYINFDYEKPPIEFFLHYLNVYKDEEVIKETEFDIVAYATQIHWKVLDKVINTFNLNINITNSEKENILFNTDYTYETFIYMKIKKINLFQKNIYNETFIDVLCSKINEDNRYLEELKKLESLLYNKNMNGDSEGNRILFKYACDEFNPCKDMINFIIENNDNLSLNKKGYNIVSQLLQEIYDSRYSYYNKKDNPTFYYILEKLFDKVGMENLDKNSREIFIKHLKMKEA